MELFHIIDDAVAIIKTKGGVYRQVKVYRRADAVYVSFGSGFIKLMSYTDGMPGYAGHGSTSCPHVSWIELDSVNIKMIGSVPKWEQEKKKLKGKL